MDLLSEIFANEVYPAMGCTEPVSCAYAAAVAGSKVSGRVQSVSLRVDRGTYKNGASVPVPQSGGRKGNMFAALLGALAAKPELKLEILSCVDSKIVSAAGELMKAGLSNYECIDDSVGFRVEVIVTTDEGECRCVLADGHTNIVEVSIDGQEQLTTESKSLSSRQSYRDDLAKMDFWKLLSIATDLSDSQREFITDGIKMNLAMSKSGERYQLTAHQLRKMKDKGFLREDMFFKVKTLVASAVDARMAGEPQAVMTSGGSGNQGVVAILTPWIVGVELGIKEDVIIESIALAHAINAYVKCFVGEISAICGCAMSAGVAAAAAIVYQQVGIDHQKITLAVNNVIGDLGGMICDGAKPGCAMKTITSVDTAMRSALMSLEGFSLGMDASQTCCDGLAGATASESIQNLGRISLEGMFMVDETVLDILKNKTTASGKA